MAKKIIINKKIIGYQIVGEGDNNEIPTNLFSWQIFRDWQKAHEYAKTHENEMPRDYTIVSIYDDDIEDPSYID